MKREYQKPKTNTVSLCGGQVFLAGSGDGSRPAHSSNGIEATISGYGNDEDSNGGFSQ